MQHENLRVGPTAPPPPPTPRRLTPEDITPDSFVRFYDDLTRIDPPGQPTFTYDIETITGTDGGGQDEVR